VQVLDPDWDQGLFKRNKENCMPWLGEEESASVTDYIFLDLDCFGLIIYSLRSYVVLGRIFRSYLTVVLVF